MAASSSASRRATEGSASGPRYIGNSSSSTGTARSAVDKQHALKTYLKDTQSHEKTALGHNGLTAEQSKLRHKADMKAKLRSLEKGLK